jgi:AcrR family transcriptional regulator
VACQAKVTQIGVIMSRWPPKTSMQDRILQTADRLFYGQGIRAIGVDTIAAEVGISKRTLYNHFASKDALIVAYLSRRFTPLTASDRPPVEQILGAFDRLERGFAAKGFRGCAFVNAVAELGESRHAANKIAVAFKENRRTWFRDLLTQLDVPDPDGLATQLALLVDGAIAGALVRRDSTMARAAKEAARVLLGAVGVQGAADVAKPDMRQPRKARAHSAAKRRVTGPGRPRRGA